MHNLVKLLVVGVHSVGGGGIDCHGRILRFWIAPRTASLEHRGSRKPLSSGGTPGKKGYRDHGINGATVHNEAKHQTSGRCCSRRVRWKAFYTGETAGPTGYFALAFHT